ncbi:YwmB family TATA-box binding protein [Paenibacillus sp. FJAT-27812]|uniref:YwmB family TATA-box binding protein n=1 Tax=Paenibacillus sp. FJAT-27812 TaxID=1684143 RepID=UPI0006A7D26B|nr:YwmB family TATA-box binding protein [Paenibacillus sp. FJAT-27812]
MYIPAKSVPKKQRLTAKQRAKQTKAGILLALLVILISASWAIWQADRAPRDTTSAEQVLQHDLKALWEWSDDQLRSGSQGASWSIRWNATSKVGSMKELVQNLFVDEKGIASDKIEQNEGKTVTGALPKYSGKLTISLVKSDSRNEELMVVLETGASQPLDPKKLLQATADISGQLVLFSPAFTSSMKVQGYTDHEQTIQRLTRLTDARSVDRYEDRGTISETFYTRMLHSAIVVENGKSANFQIALHKDTNSDNTELAIGIPVITGEYSVSKAESP